MAYSSLISKNKTENNNSANTEGFFFKPFIQRKLSVNQPGDIYEQEADAMADKVMNMAGPSPKNSFFKPAVSTLQRKCAHCEEEQKMQRKEYDHASTTASNETENYINNLSGGRSLSNNERSFFEPRIGHDFSNVRLHTDTVAAKSAQSVGALAYTTGNNIVFNEGQYSPGTDNGKKLLAHELTHVIQQTKQYGTKKSIQTSRLPCTSRKTVNVYAVSLPGSNRDPLQDINYASSVLCQCGVNINLAGGESWQTDVLDRTPPNGVLNDSNTTATTELTEMTAHRPGGDVVHIYFVPENSFGDRGGSYGYAGITPTLPLSVSVTNIGVQDTVAHELTHVLTGTSDHHPNADNLLATGSIRHVGVDELEPSQCSNM